MPICHTFILVRYSGRRLVIAEHPNADLVRRALTAAMGGSITTLHDVLAEDIMWHVAGNSPVSGDYKGREDIFAYFQKLRELTNDTLKPEPGDISGSGDRAKLMLHVTGERNGKRLDTNETLEFRVQGDQLAECWESSSDQNTWDQFWS
jgi:ketosteroid isomerase-like protein